ncbi:MAG: DegT/DnrJ/EryC1/StrS family aminotransferase [Candidatus Omnitrophica bacterium]|nr:DegT/DnrJ/EryC1/StrS family aminotransferase [Candidatus Omnitrophota bacterium]
MNIKKISHLLNLLFSRQYFGFVQGHAWLSDNQLLEISHILDSKENGHIVEEYEHKFSSMIGNGVGTSFASGRMAFYVLMKALGIGQGDEVILPAFTCGVMPNAIGRLGAVPIFADISVETLGSDAASIERKISPRTKLIVAQHSFGIPCCIEEIVALGKKKGIRVIEDSAISLGSSRDGVKVGDCADASIFSTDHTKPINTLVGGLLYTRDRGLANKVQKIMEGVPSLSKDHQRRLYKRFLYERYYFNPQRYGRSILEEKIGYHLLKGLKLRGPFLEADYGKDFSHQDYPYPARMPAFLAQLGIYELERWPQQREQRQQILKEYLILMKESGWGKFVPKAYMDKKNDIIPLRFAFCLPSFDKSKWQDFLAVDHTWFQSPVICSSSPEIWGYQMGTCPKAEEVTKCIMNWPCVVPENSRDKLISRLRSASGVHE